MASNPSEEINNQGEELLQNFQTFDLQEESFDDFQTLEENHHESFTSKFPNYRHDIEKEIEEEEQSAKISKKKRRPDFIQGAPEPKVHTYMKSLRNTIPIPRHWSEEGGDYLQGKTGVKNEKPGYQLPEFISERKLEERRQEYEGMGMGVEKVDMHVLYDAFFKYQKKPKLSGYGDLYYEGKEFPAAAAKGEMEEMEEKSGKSHWGDLQEAAKMEKPGKSHWGDLQ